MDKTNKILISISAVLMIIIISLIVLFLNKKPSTYNITFDSTGGSIVLEQSVEKHSKILRPADPTKKGYIFVEWQYNNKPFDFNSLINEDITLVAVWQEVKEDAEMITIEFDTDGGTIISRQIIEKDTKAAKPANPTKKNYKFIEWILDDKPFDFETELKENTTLKAKWEKEPEKPSEKSSQPNGSKPKENTNDNNYKPDKKEYTIIFDTNGGSEVASQKVIENDKVKEPANPTKPGYVFSSWLLNDTTYNFEELVNNDLTLLATWVANKYTISYNINTDSGSGSMENTICEYDKECQLNSNSFSKENYTFIGWSTNSNGEVSYLNNSIVKNLTTNNETITLYAVWQANE